MTFHLQYQACLGHRQAQLCHHALLWPSAMTPARIRLTPSPYEILCFWTLWRLELLGTLDSFGTDDA